jgi:SAM-dependent methyltransferase
MRKLFQKFRVWRRFKSQNSRAESEIHDSQDLQQFVELVPILGSNDGREQPISDSGEGVDLAFRAEIFDYHNRLMAWAEGASTGWPLRSFEEPTYKYFLDKFDSYFECENLEMYDHIHAVRFRNTAALLGVYLERASTLIELGGLSRIGHFAEKAFGSRCDIYQKDLRLPFEIASSSIDCVLCLEVIEHIKDTYWSESSIERIASFNYSGVNNVFSESFRILKPGGCLLVTTPNASSTDVILKVIRGEHPHVFEPHVREFAPIQIKSIGERVGFVLEAFGTMFAWGTGSEIERDRVLRFIAEMGGDPSHRGDDAVFAFKKPPAA